MDKKTYRSAQGIRARPEQMKQIASPSRPVASPTNATGPKTSSQVSLVENNRSVDTQTSRPSVVRHAIQAPIQGILDRVVADMMKEGNDYIFDYIHL
jgi:hypothetical protein